ncbi:hypothetical protein B0H66DRAFT_546418 [Apodospora peruviana]|uniref:Uncharacterized protein n=1 Tax=Apodospora peruviana TaxID=516989 RepID=A0AAE0IUV2_9PEZI|nr:hypothetical protein B0H66DRAFT_546418 [Apodospora peruviana]
MAYNLLAAAGADNTFLDAFKPAAVAARGDSHFSSNNILARQNNNSSNAVPTVNMFIDSESPDNKFAASIVNACRDQTTYAMRCTSGPSTQTFDVCGPNAPVVTFTAGPSTYIASTAVTTHTLGKDITATLDEHCSLEGTTRARCTGTVGGGVDGTSTSTQTQWVATAGGVGPSAYKRFDVAITGGAEKTATATAECKSAAPGNTALSTRVMALWGLVGAASLMVFI